MRHELNELDTTQVCRIFAKCTSYAAAERLSERTTSRELLALLAEMLLEAPVCAAVPLNLLAMLFCCPSAVHVLLGKPKHHPGETQQHAGLSCTTHSAQGNQAQATNLKVPTAQQCEPKISSETASMEGQPGHQRRDCSGTGADAASSSCMQSHPPQGHSHRNTGCLLYTSPSPRD